MNGKGRPPAPVVVRHGGELEPRWAEALTLREIEILALAASGMTDKEIAKEINISWRTVRTHVSNARNKFGVRTRTGAVCVAVGLGILHFGESNDFAAVTAEQCLRMIAQYTEQAQVLLNEGEEIV